MFAGPCEFKSSILLSRCDLNIYDHVFINLLTAGKKLTIAMFSYRLLENDIAIRPKM